nr:prolyl oligopeptidase family serine peptidase [Kineococcus siccus]
MPWQRTLLWTADVGPDHRLRAVRVLAGAGRRESLLHPGWTADGRLLVVSDRSGWWNLHRVEPAGGDEAHLVPVLPEAAEQGFPPWTFGTTSWAALDDGRVALLHGSATYGLDVVDPRTGEVDRLGLPFTAYSPVLAAAGTTVAAVAASATRGPTVVTVDVGTGPRPAGRPPAVQLVQAGGRTPDPAVLPVPQPVTVPSAGGRVVHAHRYAPTNAALDVAHHDGTAPHVLFVHGGPTSQSQAAVSPEVAYFTSRGIGVVDVQYGGSTGYGRAYREALDGAWGVVDVEDCVAVARWLVADGLAPADRIGIRGGSAGGFTVLACLTGTDAFSAGTSYYGVADLRALAADTHDFESRYLDSLVGPLPQAEDVYAARAPLNHVDGLSCPVLLLQGADDLVVPRAQAERFAEALRRKGLPHALVVFPGEQHGFRRAENVAAALEAELSFYGQVWGFDPPGVPRLDLVRGPGDLP